MVSTLAGIATRCNAGNPANVVVRVLRHEFSSNDTVCSTLQDANAVEEIVATFAGIRMFVMIHSLKTLSFSAESFDSFSKVTVDNTVHPEKVDAPIIVTLVGIVIVDNAVHPEKAEAPIVVTLAGIVIVDKDLQPEKAPAPIVVRLPKIWIFFSLLF